MSLCWVSKGINIGLASSLLGFLRGFQGCYESFKRGSEIPAGNGFTRFMYGAMASGSWRLIWVVVEIMVRFWVSLLYYGTLNPKP